MRDKFGICQWFQYEDEAELRRCVALLRDLGVRHVRTGLSWADFHRQVGPAWYERQMDALAEFEVCSRSGTRRRRAPRASAAPGRRGGLADYAEFLEQVIDVYGERFAELEPWNEPNNRHKWDFTTFDPGWRKFGEMIRLAGAAARRRGRRTALGGMIPVDPAWLELVASHGALDAVDVVAIDGFPEMWWSGAPNWEWYREWHCWAEKTERVREPAGARPIWITETGLATWDFGRAARARNELQAVLLARAAAAPAERVYSYCLADLDPGKAAIEGFVTSTKTSITWCRVRRDAEAPYERFRALLQQERRASERATG